MKKGIFFSVNLRQVSIVFFSAVLVASLGAGIHYSSLSAATASIMREKQTVIIDAGHGGVDGGTQTADGVPEKDINLAVADKLGSMLSLMGYEVVLTRDSDSIPYGSECTTIRQKKVWDTHRRMEIMKKHPDGIFVSIHQNYFQDKRYSGAQVFYSGNNPESKEIAADIQQSIADTLQKDNDRQIKKVGTEIYLLYHADIPAVMVECGFLSNENEAALLKDSDYQNKMALSIVKGLTEYFNNQTQV